MSQPTPAAELDEPLRLESGSGGGGGDRNGRLDPGAVLIRQLDLPAAMSMKQVRAAVGLQLDRLSPLPPSEILFDVALVGPSEEGNCRYAVAMVPVCRLPPGALGARGRLRYATQIEQSELLFQFRFEEAPSAAGRRAVTPDRMLLALLLLLLAAAGTRRLDRELEAVVSQADAISSSGEGAARSLPGARPQGTPADQRIATVALCTFRIVAALPAPEVKIASLDVTASGAVIVFAQGLTPSQHQALERIPGAAIASLGSERVAARLSSGGCRER